MATRRIPSFQVSSSAMLKRRCGMVAASCVRCSRAQVTMCCSSCAWNACLLRAIGGRDELRQAAELEELIDHADTRATDLGDAPVRGHQDPAQPHHALGRLAEGEQHRRSTAPLGFVPVTQRAAGHTGSGRRSALTLSVIACLRHRAETRGSMTPIMQWRRMSECAVELIAAGASGNGVSLGQFALPRVRLPVAPATPSSVSITYPDAQPWTNR
ncbi:hypothetical protein ThidrDRAFT_3665 [Thiorhodococcus drewsii AZ1]|uniref:Uncharacterized protein n=1 Tax=Thiorhodococcus drewsii AZ1 TaxID=765913 RepID=G2E5V2_9GAMM|nr:hypothetical protein ThidrDRAFT_3665 [Thiorhodococcus drewsii AZ1]